MTTNGHVELADRGLTSEEASIREAVESIGIPGLSRWRGQIREEELSQLKILKTRLTIFREMIDDSAIATLLDAVKSPLLAAEFEITEGGESDVDKEAKDFAWSALMEDPTHAWRQHVEEMLEVLEFGFSISEMVFRVREDGLVTLDGLTPIGQDTLADASNPWEIDDLGNVRSISQRTDTGGQREPIPGWKILHFTLRSRKRNPEGKSILHSIWKDWRFRKNFEELEAMGVERDIGGMPVVYPPRRAEDPEKDSLMTQFGAMRQDSQAVVIMPGPKSTGEMPGWNLEAYGSGTRSYAVREIIRDVNNGIYRRMFAQFLTLGNEGFGSQALVEGSTDFFTLGVKSIQQKMVEVWNQDLLPLLFELNAERFRGMTALPKLKWSDPGKTDLVALTALYSGLQSAGVLTITEADEDHVRGVSDLPDRPEGVGEGDRSPSIPSPGGFPSPFALQSASEDKSAGQAIRTVGGGGIQAGTNAYQRELVGIYDRWSVRAMRAVRSAQVDGLSTARQLGIVNAMLGNLESDLRFAGQANFVDAADKALTGRLGRHNGSAPVLAMVNQRIAENNELIRSSLIPSVRARLRDDILAGRISDPAGLRAAFEKSRYRPAGFAGGYWAVSFEAQRIAGTSENAARKALGQAPIPVRWRLDDAADHCEASPGFFGCPSLAGVYADGWESLTTVPAGLTTCRSNCRCVIDADFGTGWELIT